VSFRRSDRSDPASSRWRTKHRSELVACGLPGSVLDSDRALNYVLLHGDDAPGTGWTTDSLDAEQAQRLLTFLEAELGDGPGYEIVHVLRRRLQQDA
jgi:hypothetical protein